MRETVPWVRIPPLPRVSERRLLINYLSREGAATKRFSQRIYKIGINPCVDVPMSVVRWLHLAAKKSTGPVPVKGKLNGARYATTVVKYQGKWRLYLNTEMRRNAGIDVGDVARVDIGFDPTPRNVPVPRQFSTALANNKAAQRAFQKLRSSHQKEILRYLSFLKSEEALLRNIRKVISRLTARPGGWLFGRSVSYKKR